MPWRHRIAPGQDWQRSAVRDLRQGPSVARCPACCSRGRHRYRAAGRSARRWPPDRLYRRCPDCAGRRTAGPKRRAWPDVQTHALSGWRRREPSRCCPQGPLNRTPPAPMRLQTGPPCQDMQSVSSLGNIAQSSLRLRQ
jgi:hypothetical protein